MTTQTSTQKNYFNLHTTGIGYLSNIRTVAPKKGDEFLACTIGALIGEAGEGAKAEYRYFDCKVVGEAAIDLVNRAKASVEADKKVLISFVLADLWTDTFTYQKDGKNHKKGDAGVMLKARLIRIKSVKIDGVVKYQEPEKIDAQSE
ncbi:STY4534 family ICE replication protein [Mannheimia haemolytica]|uniref:STY4534 family ICE replication protein n=1 Tax=Mannheimia haemolytica TaxID=75985 RepID=UPI0025A237FA|nr:STY4534 family ICE replication protein [Mannheimia haemolytica]